MNFNPMQIDLENLDIKTENDNKAILLVVSLPPSYKHFKEILLFENIKSNLLSKDKFHLGVHYDDIVEGL